jgi:hypothetical protein
MGTSDKLHKMINQLGEKEQEEAYDVLNKFFRKSMTKRAWQEIDNRQPEDIPFSEEEKRQMEEDGEYVSWEDAKRESGWIG